MGAAKKGKRASAAEGIVAGGLEVLAIEGIDAVIDIAGNAASGAGNALAAAGSAVADCSGVVVDAARDAAGSILDGI
jgi:hypothetical protein